MNERVKQLAEQAFIITTDGKIDHVNNHMVEKFAELIVTDVIDILTTYRTRVIFEDGFEYNCEHPINAISKHFRS
jgi:hypothetical protein